MIDGKLITECLEITEPGVVIRRSRIQASCDWVVDASITTGQANWLLIEDSEIICGPGDNVAGLGERGFIARRIEILGCTNGVDGDQNFTIEDSYIHSLNSGPNDEGHGDGIQTCCAAKVIIRHNTILGRSGDLSGNGSNTTSAIILPIANSPPGPILITDNFLAGGSFTLYCASDLQPVGGQQHVRRPVRPARGCVRLCRQLLAGRGVLWQRHRHRAASESVGI